MGIKTLGRASIACVAGGWLKKRWAKEDEKVGREKGLLRGTVEMKWKWRFGGVGLS